MTSPCSVSATGITAVGGGRIARAELPGTVGSTGSRGGRRGVVTGGLRGRWRVLRRGAPPPSSGPRSTASTRSAAAIRDSAGRKRVTGSEHLHGQRDGVSAAQAERGEAGLPAPVLERVEKRGQDARAGGADRMPEGHGAPVDVHAVPVPLEFATVDERLRGERLVGFDQIEIVDVPVRLLHEL